MIVVVLTWPIQFKSYAPVIHKQKPKTFFQLKATLYFLLSLCVLHGIIWSNRLLVWF